MNYYFAKLYFVSHFDSSYSLISMKVNVRCACNTLKREWVCRDVLKEYSRSGRDPKEVPKGQFGVGLLPCGGDCVKKVEVSAPELHLRKVQEIKVPVKVLPPNDWILRLLTECVLISCNFYVEPFCGSCKRAQTQEEA